MQPLDKSLRNRLERTVQEARETAEAAARAALEQLGVGQAKAFQHLSGEEIELRRGLRAHGRQLGDIKDNNDVQEITLLVEETAYEHWHRMLFARFLAENNLLMDADPVSPVAVTLEECNDLAASQGARNGWELAARYASRMLPQIFRPGSPVFQLDLPPERQQKLEKLVAGLPVEVFTASDSLGWVYQFWQSKKKDELNAAEVKIGARELPAVTQLFTEPYMVSFLLDNSLGAWWAARRLTENDLRYAQDEDELRRKAALPGAPLEYLRFVKGEDGAWKPAAGVLGDWPTHLDELKTLDPCCGSGHFMVAALLMLVPMRMELESLSAREAVDAVLRQNLHGLELDKRCVELAAFALALTAWRYPGAGGYRVLPELNVACSGLSISAKKEEWLALAGDNTNLRRTLEELYKQFKDAPVLGSLINPEASLSKGSLFELTWEEVAPLLTKVLAGEKDEEKSEMGVVAQGIVKAASLLSYRYNLVETNVPYLGISKHDPKLIDFIEKWYPIGKYDLALAFIERIKEWITPKGTYALVSLGEWLYLGPYSKYRENYLEKHRPIFVLRLGWNAFSTPIRANPALLISSASPDRENLFSLADCSANKSFFENMSSAMKSEITRIQTDSIKRNPDLRFISNSHADKVHLSKYAEARSGLHAGDLHQFFKMHWEVEQFSWIWEPVQTAINKTAKFAGREQIIRWEQERGTLAALAESVKHLNHAAQNWRAGKPFWGKQGVVVGLMGKAACGLFSGQRYDVNSSAIIPKDMDNLPALWAFCESGTFSEQVRLLDNSLKLAPKTLLKVPFDLDYWINVAQKKYPNGLPKPYSDDPTQWIFHGHPCGSVVWDENQKWTANGPLRTDVTVLQVAVARLLGYRWPAELDPSMELADSQREWTDKCHALLPFADKDGIVCIPPVRGEASAADRLLNLLAAAYGSAWSNAMLAELLNNSGHAGKSLESWLREKFFTQHCKLFQQRPFIWHVWDGLRDGFGALVNYHKLDRKNLEMLTYLYVGDWIKRQQQDIANGVDGAEEKLAAAVQLKKSLELILAGENPYDIFVRWKPIEKQPVGWEPDLNDGVRLNIRPFMLVPDVGKAGAGILRDKPNIHWNKDKGKDVESAPWHHLFKGDRINDHHLSLKEKDEARKAKV